MRIRPSAVAGIFYPGGATQLANTVDDLLAQVKPDEQGRLRALICPHAGYRYSGNVAAHAFAQLLGLGVERVVLMGPSHRMAFRGVALPEAEAFETPLGKVPVASDATLVGDKHFIVSCAPHEQEHSLEVELPFLQRTLPGFSVTPLVFGDVDEHAVAETLSSTLTSDTLLLASSDLSHYLDYDQAVAQDRQTLDAILRLKPESLSHADACGCSPVRALLHMAQWNHWQPRLIKYQNSGDTAGERNRVVGYAAVGFYEG